MQVLNWLRDDKTLTALVLTRSRRGSDVIRLCPLEKLPERLHPQNLLTAWQALANAREPDAELLHHLLELLLQSQPLGWQSLNLPEPGLQQAPRVRATAAHPRGYKGTKTKPAKPELKYVDLRPYLQDLRWVHQLLLQLNPHLPGTLARLRSQGLEIRPEALEQAGDPWVSSRFDDPGTIRRSPLAATFLQALLPLLAGQPMAQVEAWLRLAADWKQPETHLPALCQLLSRTQPDTLLELLQALKNHSLSLVLTTLRAIAAETPLQPSALPAIKAFLSLSKNQLRPEQLAWLSWAIKAQLEPAYLLTGLKLACKHAPDFAFSSRCHGSGFPLARIQALIDRCRTGQRYVSSQLSLRLWEHWGEFPAFEALWRRIDWDALSPETATALLELLVYSLFSYWPELSQTIRKRYARLLYRLVEPELLPRLAKLDQAFQPKWLDMLSWYYLNWIAEEAVPEPLARDRLLRAMSCFARVSRPPFDPALEPAWIFAAWLEELDQPAFEAFLALPDRVLQSIEALETDRNTASGVVPGSRSLLRLQPGFALTALSQHRQRLFGVLQLLGMLQPAERKRAIEQFSDSALMQSSLEQMPLRELLETVLPLCRQQGLTSPFPHKLRAWHEQGYSLTQAQLERGRRLALEQLTLTRLDWLEVLIQNEIFAPYPTAPRSEAIRHALLLERHAEANRRAFRRFLRQLFQGDNAYLQQHPLNQRWLGRHPEARSSAWLEGLSHVYEYEGEPLTLSIEQNPFEILKMGSYVSSCLGLGGGFMYSAIAV
ncbi:MAG: hypothetical protein ACAI44_08575, partial [Candidatus Sericytochromatia bacterium]